MCFLRTTQATHIELGEIGHLFGVSVSARGAIITLLLSALPLAAAVHVCDERAWADAATMFGWHLRQVEMVKADVVAVAEGARHQPGRTHAMSDNICTTSSGRNARLASAWLSGRSSEDRARIRPIGLKYKLPLTSSAGKEPVISTLTT